MKLKTTLLAAAATLAFAPAAHAYQGMYGAIGAGLSYVGPDRDFESAGPPLAFDSEADYDNGIGVYTALGHEGANGWRKEFEFSYRQNDLRHLPGDGINFTGWNENTVDGDIQSMAFMFNLIKNFQSSGKVTPFVGVGAGMARLKADYLGADPSFSGGFGALSVNDKSWEFAYQGIAGLAFELAEGLALDISYRYFATLDPDFSGTLAGAATSFNQEYNSHSVFAGLRWNFGAAAAAAPQYKDCWDGSSVPVAADCPPQLTEDASAALDPINVIVYFDYDKSNLTPEASNLIREASARALANDVDTVVVSGHADRSGGSAYNQALSERRASVVRDALVANGISADNIRVESFGEDRPAKPTEDGVREPLNRRTEVVISFE
ncbi:MAG: OmpA family protein [Parvularculaceae bacterium]|nr:OmpA family protein [Parvularculaceae bacterium]